jgi:hypothetical protein
MAPVCRSMDKSRTRRWILGVCLLLAGLPCTAQTPVAPANLIHAARASFEGYMSHNPERLPGPGDAYRCYFDARVLPEVRLAHAQWDLGDCSARAVTAWLYLREMLGDETTGAGVERGQRRFLLSLLNPDTGLASVPELSSRSENAAYYHVWDQGRTLRALVQWYRSLPAESAESVRIRQAIEKMIQGLSRLKIDGRDPVWGDYVFFKSDIYINLEPHPSPKFYWTWGGQLIEPLVEWAGVTRSPAAVDFAARLANGILSGRQSAGYTGAVKRALEFGSDGTFTSHFHNRSSVLLGIVKLAEALYARGDRQRALTLIRRVRQIYDWIFDANRNINAAGSYGWFPEDLDDGKQARVIAEPCCMADMIELAAELAQCSTLDSSLTGYSALWDDVERFTRNGLLRSQFYVTARYERLLRQTAGARWSPAMLERARQMEGGWCDAIQPNNLTRVISKTGTPFLSIAGCCSYSGPRGLYASWRRILRRQGSDLFVNMSLDRDSPWASIRSGLPQRGEVQTILRQPLNVHYRMPRWVDHRAVRVSVNATPVQFEWDRDAPGYLVVRGRRTGDRIVVTFPVVEKVTKEKMGGDNSGDDVGVGFSEPGNRIEYTLTWRGDDLVSIAPPARFLPVVP